MSNFDLHEFNILSQRHNYFMTNNRINGFPSKLEEPKIIVEKNNNQIKIRKTQKKRKIRAKQKTKIIFFLY